MVIVAAESTGLDLRNVIAYPITDYPLSLAHSDGSMLKGTFRWFNVENRQVNTAKNAGVNAFNTLIRG